MARFHSDEFINEAKKWNYPKIHQKIRRFTESLMTPQNFLDLWACYNLLSVGMLECPSRKNADIRAFAVEPNKNYREKALKHDKLYTLPYTIDSNNEPRISTEIAKNNIELVLARRVFPEIEENEPWYVKKFWVMLHSKWVKYIILEGRRKTKNAKAKLYCWKKEAIELTEHYEPIKKHWEIFLLRRK